MSAAAPGAGGVFSYRDGRFFRDGEPFFVRGVEYQYYRDRSERWEARLRQLADAHASVITFYVPWRHHLVEYRDGRQRFDLQGSTLPERDVAGFIERCGRLGLYVIAKPGPFVHSELNIGGLPDLVSPGVDPAIEPARGYDGSPLRWDYDGSILPSSEDARFDALAREWLEAVGALLRDQVAPAGPLIAVQLNDETLYCTSNAPPWTLGYEAPALRGFARRLEETYGSIDAYNRVHDTRLASFAAVAPPAPPGPDDPPLTPAGALARVDWARHQWRLRRDAYARYRDYLDVDVPHLTNYAGMTPPIEESVPRAKGAGTAPEAGRPEPADAHTLPLYAEWWLAMNRIEADLDVHEYGVISWLGVAAYDICDLDSRALDNPCRPARVLDRYLNTCLRRRGINLEENWGFARLYHPFSAYPLVPVYQTLASVAGGCTGYVVFCGVQHDHWDDDLDRITRLQHPTFPSDAPIAADGTPTPMYGAMALLNRWFEREGSRYLRAELRTDVCWLAYAPYAAVSSWIPPAQERGVAGHESPRAAVDGFEPFAARLHAHGLVPGLVDLEAVSLEQLLEHPVCALRLGFFMDGATQEKLLAYVERGGTLLCCGEPPRVDLQLRACSVLADALRPGAARPGTGRVHHVPAPGFLASADLLPFLKTRGLRPAAVCSDGVRALVYAHAAQRYVWFLGLDGGPGPHAESVTLEDVTLELELGAKTCGVVHLDGDRIASVLFKGHNEVEGIEATVSIRLGDSLVRHRGDLLRFYDP